MVDVRNLLNRKSCSEQQKEFEQVRIMRIIGKFGMLAVIAIRVHTLCAEGQIEGASRFGIAFAIHNILKTEKCTD